MNPRYKIIANAHYRRGRAALARFFLASVNFEGWAGQSLLNEWVKLTIPVAP
jgi:hypothetical protein